MCRTYSFHKSGEQAIGFLGEIVHFDIGMIELIVPPFDGLQHAWRYGRSFDPRIDVVIGPDEMFPAIVIAVLNILGYVNHFAAPVLKNYIFQMNITGFSPRLRTASRAASTSSITCSGTGIPFSKHSSNVSPGSKLITRTFRPLP